MALIPLMFVKMKWTLECSECKTVFYITDRAAPHIRAGVGLPGHEWQYRKCPTCNESHRCKVIAMERA